MTLSACTNLTGKPVFAGVTEVGADGTANLATTPPRRRHRDLPGGPGGHFGVVRAWLTPTSLADPEKRDVEGVPARRQPWVAPRDAVTRVVVHSPTG